MVDTVDVQAGIGQATVVLSGITKTYAGVTALADVSIEVRPGEVHALLGENGAGKSTLVGVASGTTVPDSGTITFLGDRVESMTPALATSLGIAVVHQHPAVLPDMTVAENVRVAVPRQVLKAGGDERATIRRLLAEVGATVHLEDRVGSLSVAQKHLLELAKALAVEPKLLILDEPTAPLGQDLVEVLFGLVRSAAARGTAIVYITHRLAEVRELADRVTVLRDGRVRGGAEVGDITDDELLAMIVGRRLEQAFPPKYEPGEGATPVLEVVGLSSDGFSDVSFTAVPGEIVGIAGVVGNGQSALLRVLAGRQSSTGTVRIGGDELRTKQLLASAAYMPADRHREGLMMSLTVRENAAVSALPRFRRAGLLRRRTETTLVGQELRSLAVKAPSMEAGVATLSGGNQQKVVLSRALLSRPSIVVADEPTQGVDVGARAEIYRILREISASGIPVVIASSDAMELEGLCDRVLVMSRGHCVETLTGEDITEERIVHAAVRSTTARSQAAEPGRGSTRLRRFVRGDYAPVVALGVVILALAAYISSQNARYLNPFNVSSVLMLCAALGFIAMGQTIALLIGSIDLSVGPLSGFLVVLASFFVNDGRAGPVVLLGFALVFAAAAGTGAANGWLIRFGGFTAVAATLTTYIALQGLSFLLRDAPGGIIASDVTTLLKQHVGTIPGVFVGLVVATAVMEYVLRRRPWGLRLRAVGSDIEAARRVGVRVNQTVLLGHVVASLFVAFGAVVLLAQLGIGDPAQGVGYTLSSITAVVLGGTSLLGGRGTFLGTLLGTVLIVQMLNATTFLNLTQTWQYIFQGGFVLVAALAYSRARGSRQTFI